VGSRGLSLASLGELNHGSLTMKHFDSWNSLRAELLRAAPFELSGDEAFILWQPVFDRFIGLLKLGLILVIPFLLSDLLSRGPIFLVCPVLLSWAALTAWVVSLYQRLVWDEEIIAENSVRAVFEMCMKRFGGSDIFFSGTERGDIIRLQIYDNCLHVRRLGDTSGYVRFENLDRDSLKIVLCQVCTANWV